MSERLGPFLLCGTLAGCLLLAGHRGVLLVAAGTAVTAALGAAVLALSLLGAWFLWRCASFVRAADRLARAYHAEEGPRAGASPARAEPKGSPSGRLDPTTADAADVAFAARRAEAEADPENWRVWFALAVAYREARDTPRARRAMQHAITVHARAVADPAEACDRRPTATGR